MSAKNKSLTGAAMIASVIAMSATTVVPAQANNADVVRRGNCSGATDWKLKASPEDGRIEVEGEVDSNRNGQTWTWRIRHNGGVSAGGTATTRAPGGSFEVRRLIVNSAGTDTVGWRASNANSGEVCTGSLRF